MRVLKQGKGRDGNSVSHCRAVCLRVGNKHYSVGGRESSCVHKALQLLRRASRKGIEEANA